MCKSYLNRRKVIKLNLAKMLEAITLKELGKMTP